MADNDAESLLASAGLGGAVVCCAALELLGGTALLGGVAAALGFSTGITYAAVVGIGGVLAMLAVLSYQQVGEITNV